MVLQKSPMKANIWGYLHNSAVNSKVSVELDNKKYNAVYIKGLIIVIKELYLACV